MTKKSTENEIWAKGNNSCKSKSNATKVKLNLYYVKTNSYTKFQVNITKDRREKFRKLNFAKGNNWRKSKSNTTKVKLDLYYVKANPYTKFQVNISEDDWEKNRKTKWTDTEWTNGQTDGQTDGRTNRLTDGEETPPPGSTSRGLIMNHIHPSQSKGTAVVLWLSSWLAEQRGSGFKSRSRH